MSKEMKIKIKDANRRLIPTTGYGQMSAAIGRGLDAKGHDVYYDYVTGSTDNDLERIAKKPFKHTQDTIYLWIRPPHYVKYKEFDKKNINVFYTMHESETFEGWKADWPELLNRCNAVIVPTEWNKRIFKERGVEVPIYVVPLGVNPQVFHGAKTKEFSILSVHEALGKKGSRESWADSVEAYLLAFKDNPMEVSFTIKSWNTDIPSFYKFVFEIAKKIGEPYQNLPQFNIIETDLLPQDMNALFGKHWVFLKDSKREGWCLPVHEAMATGMNIICSDLPPMREFLFGKKVVWFELGNVKKLTEVLVWEFKQWRKWKGHVNSFSWKANLKKLEEVLYEIKKD